MAFTLITASIIALILAYRTITRRIVPGILKPDDRRSSPARRYMDGKETLPLPTSLLTIFQFQAITLDPVISPVIALQFGWLPALLWVLLGSIVWGWLQSYLVAIISMRSGGACLTGLVESLISKRAYKLFLFLIFFLLLLLVGHFTNLSSILVDRTTTAPALALILLISIVAGQLIFRLRWNHLCVSIFCIVLSGAAIFLSTSGTFSAVVTAFNRIVGGNGAILLSRTLGGGELSQQTAFWMLLVLLIGTVIAALPVWRLAIPFNYLSGSVVLIIMILTIIGLGIGQINSAWTGNLEIPAVIGLSQDDLGPIWPVLFMLFTSGSISGWQALVASQSTSRLVEKESRLLPVTIGAQLISAMLVIVVIVLGAAFGVSSGSLNPDQGFRLAAGPASVVAFGLQQSSGYLGIPGFLAGNAGLILLTLVSLTSVHLALRYSGQLLVRILGDTLSAMKNPAFACTVIAAISYILILLDLWQWLWPLFAGIALLISGYVFMLAATWLARQGKSTRWIYRSGILIFVTAWADLFYESFYVAGYENIILLGYQDSGFLLGNSLTLGSGLVVLGTASILLMDYLNRNKTEK